MKTDIHQIHKTVQIAQFHYEPNNASVRTQAYE